MKIVWIQHESFEGPEYIREWAKNRGHEISGVMAFDNQPLPALDTFDLLVVMGGPMSVHDDAIFPWIQTEKRFLKEAITAGKSILGICLGAQLLADALGAGVRKNLYREIGWFDVRLCDITLIVSAWVSIRKIPEAFGLDDVHFKDDNGGFVGEKAGRKIAAIIQQTGRVFLQYTDRRPVG